MALPTQPTLDTLTVEALIKAGYPGISADDALQLRAETWVEELKTEIASHPDLKPLQGVAYTVTAKGVSRYANPDDCLNIKSVAILKGVNTGTANGTVSASTVKLKSGHGLTEEFLQGKLIILTSGTGVGNCSQISSLSTDTVTVTPNFNGSSFAGTETYIIVDEQRDLILKDIQLRDIEINTHDLDVPAHYFPIGQANSDSDETGEFQVFPVPNDIYGVQIRYYADLRLTDLTSNLMKTLYRRWWNLWDQGVYFKALKNDHNNDWKDEYKVWQKMVADHMSREKYGHNISNLQATVDMG